MTINLANNNPRISYSVAQGATQQTFAVPFEFFNDSDITVYVDGVLKTEGSDYTLTGGDGSTGNVVFVTATPPAVQQVLGATGGSTVVIFRTTDIERTSDFSAGSDINRAALNEQLDILTAMIADQNDKTDRTIRLNDYETAPSLILPSIANRKGKVLAFNATTGAVEQGPSVSSVDTVANSAADIQTVADNIDVILASPANASAAAASASAASGSASAASGSASAASSSASAAASSASTAATLLDSFDDRYLGPKASAPSVDNDGNTLLVGTLYWNTTSNNLFVWSGSAWNAGALDTGSLGNMSTQNSNAVSITGGSAALTGVSSVTVSSASPALTINQTGAGAAILVEDSASPDSTPFVVTATGNVGVGTTSPSSKLEVTGDVLSVTSGTVSVAARSGDNTDYSQLRMRQTATESRLESFAAGTGTFAPLTMFTNSAERLRIGTAGQFGIGGANYGTSGQTIVSAGSAAAPAWGTLPVAGGGTGVTTSTGTGSVVLSASPALTGTPTAPTATVGTNTTQIATTAFVQSASGYDAQIFTASGTWTKPASAPSTARVNVRMWGAGGGGARRASGSATGGTGGAYTEFTLLASDLAATVSVTVGAGGLGRSTDGNGNNGGNSVFNGVTAYGGGGGAQFSGSGGTSGGGQLAAGSQSSFNRNLGGGTWSDVDGFTTPDLWGGAAASNQLASGSSCFGGAGGAGSASGTAGTSKFGGNGGAIGGAGVAPAGGGGGSGSTSGAGARGEVRIYTTW